MDESKLEKLAELCPEAAALWRERTLGQPLNWWEKGIEETVDRILELGDRVETLEAEYRRLWLAGERRQVK